MAKKKEETKNEEVLTETEETKNQSREEEIKESALQKELEEVKALLAEKEDRLLRTLAEFDNFKKRSVKEKEDLFFTAKSEVIKTLLPVFDNLDRASGAADFDSYRKGVEMILSQFGEILTSMDIRSVANAGDPFDPVFHEAIFREEKEGVEENTITEVLQKGYAIGDKVIRHAMVKVSG